MLGVFLAGRYTSTIAYPSLSALSLGITQEGYNLSWQSKWDVMESTDAFGVNGTIVEEFYQGMNMNISGIFKEFLPGTIRSVQPLNSWAGTGASSFNLGTIGLAATDQAGVLVLTAVAGTPAATSPATLTASFALNVGDTPTEQMFGPKHRVWPFNFRLFPYNASGTIKFFTST